MSDSSPLETTVGPLTLANPVMSASGTFGSGWEGRSLSAVGRLGALVSKTITVRPRHGNRPRRIVETPSGMLNSIGLENRGADVFERDTLPKMKSLGTKVVLNIGGESIEEFTTLAARFSAAGVDALEVNLSCPNVDGGRLLFSTIPEMTERAVRATVEASSVPVFAKLSPNVTSITEIAEAAERGGAQGITAINTLIGMAVDWRRRKPILGMTIGGLSGPAIKPVALRMVHEIAGAVSIPVLGVGGIQSAEDVLEFLAAGASAVQIGTACFTDPECMVRILDELEVLLRGTGRTVADVHGCLGSRSRAGEEGWQ